MKLAEALLLRADRTKTYEQLRARISATARYQEGEQPAEDAGDLLTTTTIVLDELEVLIRQINHTNAVTRIAAERTITDALAERDVLRLRHAVISGAADAASGSRRGGFMRATRSELRNLTDLDVPALRARASDLARRLRELDGELQQANWTVDLVES